MAVKCCENFKYQKIDWDNYDLRPHIKKKVDNNEDLSREDYETMTYGDYFYINNGFSYDEWRNDHITEYCGIPIDPKKMKGHFVIF